MGAYTVVDVWADKTRFKVSLDRYLNIISIARWSISGGPQSYLSYHHWRQEFHRSYKRKRPFSPLHTDIIYTAVEAAKHKRRPTSPTPTLEKETSPCLILT